MRVAYEIVVDKRSGLVTIDGVAFPYYLSPDVQVDGTGPCEMLAVTLSVYADNVTVRDRDGSVLRVSNDEDVVEAAGAYARRLVQDGLSDALPWLRHARHVADEDGRGRGE